MITSGRNARQVLANGGGDITEENIMRAALGEAAPGMAATRSSAPLSQQLRSRHTRTVTPSYGPRPVASTALLMPMPI